MELSANLYVDSWASSPCFTIRSAVGDNLWQQSKVVLEPWMEIRSTVHALTQLLALQLWGTLSVAGHRTLPQGGVIITAGFFARWL